MESSRVWLWLIQLFSEEELTDLVAFDTSSFAITTHCIAYSSGAVLCSIQILGLGLAEHS
jgi:hypothetical protein